jgi:hypothetical protein
MEIRFFSGGDIIFSAVLSARVADRPWNPLSLSLDFSAPFQYTTKRGQRVFRIDSSHPAPSSYLLSATRRNSIHLIKISEQWKIDSQ